MNVPLLIRLGGLIILFLWVIMAVWPYRMAIVAREKANDRTGILSGQEYSLLAQLHKTNPSDPNFLKLKEELGCVYWQQGTKKNFEAEKIFKEVHNTLKLAASTSDQYNQDYVQSTENLAALYRDLGRFVEAAELYKEVLQYDERLHADDAKLARDHGNIGVVQYFNGLANEDPTKRQEIFLDADNQTARAVEMYRKKLGPDAQDVGNQLANQALILRDMGRDGEALRAKAESQRIRALIPTPSTPP